MECQLPITGLSGHFNSVEIKSDNKGLCQIKSLYVLRSKSQLLYVQRTKSQLHVK